MWTGLARAATIAALATGSLAAAATGAPVAAGPPTITGSPSFGATLTCNTGNWSTDAAGFDYAWAYGNGGPTFATGQTWRVDVARVSYTIVCVVTARDLHGASTTEISKSVVPHEALSTVRITGISQRRGALTVTGVVGPAGALAGRFGYTPTVVLARELPDFGHLRQIGTARAISRNGTFTITAHDRPGRHTYVVTFTPPANDPFDVADVIRTVTIAR
jgi:hypothetical protein